MQGSKDHMCKVCVRHWNTSLIRLGTGRPAFGSRQGLEFYLLPTASRPPLGLTKPPIQWVPGALSPGIKRSGREADHLPKSDTGVKNAWRCASILPYVFSSWWLSAEYVFIAWYFVKHRDNFTVTLRYSSIRLVVGGVYYHQMGGSLSPIDMWELGVMWSCVNMATTCRRVVMRRTVSQRNTACWVGGGRTWSEETGPAYKGLNAASC